MDILQYTYSQLQIVFKQEASVWLICLTDVVVVVMQLKIVLWLVIGCNSTYILVDPQPKE